VADQKYYVWVIIPLTGLRETLRSVLSYLVYMTWPTVASDVSRYAASCEVCQKRARITCYDHVKIVAIPRDTEPFRHWFMDCAGP